MQAVRTIYARSHALGSLLIQRYDSGVTPGLWSHCGAIVDTRGEPFVVEAQMLHGVVATPLQKFVSRYSAVEVVEHQAADARAGDAWVCAQIGKRYDWEALLGFLTRESWQDEDAWQCAELVETRNVRAGVRERIRNSPAKITPNISYMVP